MTAQALLSYDQVPWTLVIPVTAGLVATGMAFLLSRFLFARAPVAEPSRPPEKPTAEFDPFVQGSATEQRRTFRRGGSSVEVQIGDAERKGKVSPGWVVDRSVGGLCVAVGDPLAEGSVLTVRAVNAPPSTPWVEIEVKSCRQTKDDWELGCAFVKTPPWAVMLLFG